MNIQYLISIPSCYNILVFLLQERSQSIRSKMSDNLEQDIINLHEYTTVQSWPSYSAYLRLLCNVGYVQIQLLVLKNREKPSTDL